ncbi:MAG: hypothetical protein R3307_09175, partial [Anaerolineales bacterium]|nr:hypothetical protein [Anaerolineales bacterium]
EEVDALLPDSSHPNFRDRLVEYVGDGNSSQEFRLKAIALLDAYERIFGVDDLIDRRDEEDMGSITAG